MKGRRRSIPLIPRYLDQGFSDDLIESRRTWLEDQVSVQLPTLGQFSMPGESMRGNIENPIGACQIPLGIAGPLDVHGDHANGRFFVPMATTEGALVRSYERGMIALTKSGGVTCRVLSDTNELCPVLECEDLKTSLEIARSINELLPSLQRVGDATTQHGSLLQVETLPIGRRIHCTFTWSTGDAHGMNMIAKGTQAVCQWMVEHTAVQSFLLFSGASGEKRPTGRLFSGGKGKSVVAGARIPEAILRTVLHVTAKQLIELWQQTVVGHLRSASLGYNGHIANGLTAVFIACGQDVANVANSAVGITTFEALGADLYASIHLPSITVGTVGGGTALATSAECLRIVQCEGSGAARKFAEILAGMALAGELSIAAALASHEFVAAHESYGRNRPEA